VGGRFALRGFASSSPILVVMHLWIAELHRDLGRDCFLRDAARQAVEGAMNSRLNQPDAVSSRLPSLRPVRRVAEVGWGREV
jgi:hypothetical protein